MANPRKFSEKIALHNQKQAEETAAFEAIMRDVSEATRGSPYPKPGGLHLSPNLGTYRGGSLPNVNQIDLQSALHNLNDMKHGRDIQVDRMHRDRVRQVPTHSRPARTFPLDKRVDCSPYGVTYLSPPADTSWRRTNSDSALHTSAMTQQADPNQSPNTPPTHRRGNCHNICVAQLSSDNTLQATDLSQTWDPKKQLSSRPKSCEVPGINIYPSPEQDSGVHIPISNNTGSLPDLSSLHFPPPLSQPLDTDDQNYPPGGSPLSLSPTSTPGHIGAVRTSQQTSPSLRRRHPHGGPSPLVIHGSPTQMRHNIPQQAGSLDGSRVDQRLHVQGPYHPYKPASLHQQAVLNQAQNRQTVHNRNSLSPPGGAMPPNHMRLPGASPTSVLTIPVSHSQFSPNKSPDYLENMLISIPNSSITLTLTDTNNQVTVPVVENGVSVKPAHSIGSSHPPCQSHNGPTLHGDKSGGSNMTQYRNNTTDNSCQSPTSPLSQPSYSPSQSPGLPPSTVSSSPFTDPYWQQHSQQQTTALQHQFEQFSMLQDNQPSQSSTNGSVNLPLYGGQMNLQMSQAMVAGLSGSQDFAQPQQTQQQAGHYYQQQSTPQQQSPQQGSPQPPSPQAQGSPHQVAPPTSSTAEQTHQTLTPQNSNQIPDIILTGGTEGSWVPILQGAVNPVYGADDSIQRQDFARELGNAMAGMTDSLDSDLFTPDEALRVGLDPLDLDGLQMLDPGSLVTDPATEDSFRMDRL